MLFRKLEKKNIKRKEQEMQFQHNVYN
jgi:hypothetical protein